jgi:hypothetical protein
MKLHDPYRAGREPKRDPQEAKREDAMTTMTQERTQREA